MLCLNAPPGGFYDNPYPIYKQLREEEPVCRQEDGSYILSCYADLDRVYRDTGRFLSDKKGLFAPKFGLNSPLFEHHTNSLVFNDPPLHSRVRRAIVDALSPRALLHMEPGLIRLVDDLLGRMKEHAQIDLIDDFAAIIPLGIIGNLLGIPQDMRGCLRQWSLAILGALEPELSAEQLDRGNQAVLEFKALLRDLIKMRRANPNDPQSDLLTRLINAVGNEGLSEIELIQNCIFILNAGHETTTNLIGNALCLLDRHRDVRTHLLARPELMASAVDEFLRIESPNQFGNRLTACAVDFHGVAIGAGANLHLCIGAANRDPRQFPDAETILPGRRPNRHLAFAGGAHTCAGLTLARMEGRIAIGRFLNRYPDYQLSGNGQRDQRIRFRGYVHLPARHGGSK